MFNLEKALATWRHQYKYSRAFKGRDLDELEQHLRDQIAFLVDAGQTEEEAFREAISELGTFHETESEFRTVAWMKTRDRREIGQELRHQCTMIASYLRIAARNLRKNRVPTSINLVGLSVAIAVTMVSYTFVSKVLTRDHHHPRANDLYLVHQVTQEPHGEQLWGHTQAALGPALATSSPLVDSVVRIEQRAVTLSHDGSDFDRVGHFVDPDFFSMFSFPTASGSVQHFGSEPGVVLSASWAETLFGAEDPVGQSVTVAIEGSAPQEVVVMAVSEPFTTEAGIQYLMAYPLIMLQDRLADDWRQTIDATFIRRTPGVSESALGTALQTWKDRANAADPEWQIIRYEIDGIKDLAWNRENVQRSMANSIPWAPVVVLSLISGLLLLLACFNYMNVSMATATRRLREIGVRKAVGGNRKQLMVQFLTENILLSFVGLLLGMFIAWSALLPVFSQISGHELDFGLTRNLRVWVFMAILVTGIGFLSGAYPAFFVSSFQPTAIFQHRLQLRRRRPLSHGFLAVQFLLAFLTMSVGIVLTWNGQYLASKDWGYDAEQLVTIHTDSVLEVQWVKGYLGEQPGVLDLTSGREVIGFSYNEQHTVTSATPIEGVETFVFGADRDYTSFLGLERLSGHLLSDSLMTAGPEAIVVNETFVKETGLSDPIGSVVELDSIPRVVVGVVADFHHEDFFSLIRPTAFEDTGESDHRIVSARLMPGQTSMTMAALQKAHREAFNGKEARVRYQDQIYASFQEESMGIALIFLFVAVLALIISCLSIYALSAQNVLNRLKEIGVRKVLGGAPLGIAHLINRRYVIIMTIGSVLALPLAWIGLDTLLNDIYAYAMDLSIAPFLITYAIILGVSLLTITTQARTIRRSAPAEILRVE